jgi:hypothetical protein
VRPRESYFELKKKIASWSLRDGVRAARILNRRLSLHRGTGNRGSEISLVEAIRKLSGMMEGKEWKGITFFQCPQTGYLIMRIPPFSFTESFLELEEMAWEAREKNEGIRGPDIQERVRRIRKIQKRKMEKKRWCACGCGTHVYGKNRWVMGHNGRVEGWFHKGLVPSGFELDYEKWRATGCLAKLEEL